MQSSPIALKSLSILFAWLTMVCQSNALDDVLIADFESGNYSGWRVTGTAFGVAPVMITAAGGTVIHAANVDPRTLFDKLSKGACRCSNARSGLS